MFMAAAALLALAACKPEEIKPKSEELQDPLTSVTAYLDIFGYQDVEFVAYPDENGRIEFELPVFYPEESDDLVPLDAIQNAKLVASLANNVTISPMLNIVDLTKENEFTVTDQLKQPRKYVITGRQVSGNLLTSFKLDTFHDDVNNQDISVTGVIIGDEVYIPYMDPLPTALKATYEISPHAKISPDPSRKALDYNTPFDLTVTSYNGVEHVYRVKQAIPPKREKGLRPGSGRILFAKKLYDDLGVTQFNLTTSLGILDGNLAVNTRGEDIMLLHPRTGVKTGTYTLGQDDQGNTVKGDLVNFCITSDDNGELLMSNLIPNAEAEFKIWRIRDASSKPELFIHFTPSDATLSFGRKISVQGSLSGDAVITAPCHTNPTLSFYRWVVKDGALVGDGKPEWVTVQGLAQGWNTNVDLIHMEATPESDYFVHAYSLNQLSWVSGTSNQVKHQLEALSVNYVPNALDLTWFNGAPYLAAVQLNSFPWGGADICWLLDLTSEDAFKGKLDEADPSTNIDGDGNPRAPQAQIWSSINTYGAKAIGYDDNHPLNENFLSDVLLSVSEDGNYMYLYFMFCHGYVVGVQFDCIVGE